MNKNKEFRIHLIIMRTTYNFFQSLLWICLIYTLLNPDLYVTAEKGWEVFTEIDSEEVIIPRTIKMTKAPHKEEVTHKSKAEINVDRRVSKKKPEKEDEEKEKTTEKKHTEKPEEDEEGPEYERDFQREIRIGRKKKGKKIGKEVSIKLPKEVQRSSNLNYFSSYIYIINFLPLICVYNERNHFCSRESISKLVIINKNKYGTFKLIVMYTKVL
ncbi:hypothetical protein Smp_138560 [Schistosoma mansoni]|uniref:hypothetical protein n=1 Tax=Schistosoma mansoni TaxID=6183 RepID=UPI0001A63EA8|nr:hypothetical protein Smp_138560 [Schistosoma mansoni]|eukprot:XP_018644187.1 hypothetical protein Smp_138560 [Schistosoma mansoni]